MWSSSKPYRVTSSVSWIFGCDDAGGDCAGRYLLDRSLLELRISQRGPRAFFTEAGLTALRQLVLDGRAMDPARFAHLRLELGIDPESLAAE